jgi:hypothetical protein
MEKHPSRIEHLNMKPPAELPNRFQHLLRVAESVSDDAQQVWTQLWGEIKPHVTAAGTVSPNIVKGFVPACGWSEFLERMWLLKHYLDSVHRICQETEST